MERGAPRRSRLPSLPSRPDEGTPGKQESVATASVRGVSVSEVLPLAHLVHLPTLTADVALVVSPCASRLLVGECNSRPAFAGPAIPSEHDDVVRRDLGLPGVGGGLDLQLSLGQPKRSSDRRGSWRSCNSSSRLTYSGHPRTFTKVLVLGTNKTKRLVSL